MIWMRLIGNGLETTQTPCKPTSLARLVSYPFRLELQEYSRIEKGNTTTYGRGTTYPVPNADTEWHNYTTYWTENYLEWWVDNTLIRNLTSDDPLTLGGTNYPQTPCQIKISIWPAGTQGTNKWTVQWAGGYVNWDEAPFTMSVKSLRAKDFHTGKEYTYGDRTGDAKSIKVIE